MKKSHGIKYKIVLMSIVFLVLVVLVVALFFMIKKSSEHASLLSQTTPTNASTLYKGVSEKDARESTAEEIKKINSYLVDKEGSVGLIEMVESEAAEDNVALTIASVGTEKFAEADTDSAKKEFLRLRLDAEGKWSDIIYFLSFIEHMPYGINLIDATFSQIATEKNKQPVWRAKIELTVLKHK